VIFNTTVLVGELGLLALQAIAAYWIGMLTPNQMMARGRPQGLPLVAHGGMWGNLLLTALTAHFVTRYGAQWTKGEWVVALIVGTILSGGMHWVYKTYATIPEAHVLGHRLTFAGWTQFVYMAYVLAVLILFYLGTERPYPTRGVMWANTSMLAFYLAIGNHFILGLVAPSWYPNRPLRSPIGWATVIGGSAVLGAVTWLRVGI